ncbi:MAG TPA: hypothetical protein VME46_00125 [Acidimicrobiales bacterium]|nr:hypothetical protein [Acidimicrobiales bacterium]
MDDNHDLDSCQRLAMCMSHFAGRLSVISALAIAVLCLWSSGAGATVGAGVQAAPVVLAHPAHPGQQNVSFPRVYVVNTGTQTSRYRLRVERLSTGNQMPVPAGWVSFGDEGFLLAPHQAITVTVSLSLPKDAKAGKYMTDVVASTAPLAGGGASEGAAAATKLEFTLSPLSSGFDPLWLVFIAIALVIAVAGVVVLQKRRRTVGPGLRGASPTSPQVTHRQLSRQGVGR